MALQQPDRRRCRAAKAMPGKRFSFLGAVLDDPEAAELPRRAARIDWGGVYGHNWFIDPANGLTVVVLTNTALEGCNGPFREDIRDAVYAPAR